MQLTTRHITSSAEDGVFFDASIDKDAIELQRVQLADIGTCIKIKLTKESARKLRLDRDAWDWYVLTKPTIERAIGGKEKAAARTFPVWTDLKQQAHWRVIKPKGFQAVQWAYEARHKRGFSREFPLFACNGIIIGGGESRRKERSLDTFYGFPSNELLGFPSVLVYDPDAQLPLNLQRSNLKTGSLPFADELMTDVFKDFIAFLLLYGPKDLGQLRRFQDLRTFPVNDSAVWNGRFRDGGLLFAQDDSFGVLHPSIFKAIGITTTLIYLLRRRDRPVQDLYASGVPQVFDFVGYDRDIDTKELMWSEGRWGNESQYVTKRSAALLLTDGNPYMRKAARQARQEGLPEVNLGSGAIMFRSRKFGANGSLLKSINEKIANSNEQNIAAVTELQFDWSRAKVEPSVFSKVWSKICPLPLIPFAAGERRKRFAATFVQLKDYIALWEHPEPSGWRARLLNEIQARKMRK